MTYSDWKKWLRFSRASGNVWIIDDEFNGINNHLLAHRGKKYGSYVSLTKSGVLTIGTYKDKKSQYIVDAAFTKYYQKDFGDFLSGLFAMDKLFGSHFINRWSQSLDCMV